MARASEVREMRRGGENEVAWGFKRASRVGGFKLDAQRGHDGLGVRAACANDVREMRRGGENEVVWGVQKSRPRGRFRARRTTWVRRPRRARDPHGRALRGSGQGCQVWSAGQSIGAGTRVRAAPTGQSHLSER
jgi:hypothetical protein